MSVTWQTSGVNQSPYGGTDYPFLKPSADIEYLLSDLWLSYADDSLSYVLPLRVIWMYGFGGTSNSPIGAYTPVHSQDIVIADAVGAVVFDSTLSDSFLSTAWGGGGLKVLQWLLADNALRCTWHDAGPPPWDADHNSYEYIIPDNGTLDPRTYERLPLRVRSITVGDVTFSPGDLKLSEGYNIQLTSVPPAAADVRFTSQIAIRGRPGDGLGRYNGCGSTEPVVRRINSIGPDSAGNFILSAVECYRIELPANAPSIIDDVRSVTLVENNALEIANDCGPCCDCEDYVRTYMGLINVYNQFAQIGSTATTARSGADDAIVRWNGQLACRTATTIRLTAQGEVNSVVFIGGLFGNASNACLHNIVLRITLQTFGADGGVIDLSSDVVIKRNESFRTGSDTGYVEVPYVLDGTYPVYDTYFDYADPLAVSSMRFRIAYINNAAVDGDSITVTMSLHVPDQAGASLPDPSSITIPSAVAAIWVTHPEPFAIRAITSTTVPFGPDTGCGTGTG